MGFEVEKEKRHQELWDPQPRSVSEKGRKQSNSRSLSIALIIFFVVAILAVIIPILITFRFG